ncbi:UbiA family prenyltransferase [Frigoribacterium sp. PvP032]|uniref:UbiA family prenyltransferase n=1 Tax=Frigoribacterium sp. PvP032 TaxID=2806589 RepID=UPI001B723FFC|nr:UbiA family prenyltransferase [Frigoribacterium sp. PvP032]MBP1190081.1 4-hydroxybenzoate polyprenyltransferase [Frigoribacterium sp. PvP032]
MTTSPVSTVAALARSTHPGPTVAVTLLSVVLATAVGLDAGRTLVLGAAVLAGQLSIGLSNDLVDAARDRQVGRLDKPLALGLVSTRAAMVAVTVVTVLAVGLTFLLGWAAGVAHLVFLVSGWAYNLGLKRTAWSVVPFVVGFGALPAVVTLAAAPPAEPAAWALIVGAAFGVAIHFTNVLPDLDDDARTGVVGLPHRLGRLRAGLVAFAALGTAAVVTAAGLLLDESLTPVRTGAGLVGAATALVLSAVGARLVRRGGATRGLFRLVIAAALVLVVSLALAGTALVA